jgi:hypothetical protein
LTSSSSKYFVGMSLFFLLMGLSSFAFYYGAESSMLSLLGKRLRLNPIQEEQVHFVQEYLWYAGFFAVLLSFLSWGGRRGWQACWQEYQESSRSVPSPTTLVNLFVVSFLSLYFEMIFIRWVSTEVRILAFFKNVPLIAAFLGLGLGCLLARSPKRLEFWFLPVLSLFLLFVGFGSDTYLRFLSFAGATLFEQEHHIWGHTLPASLYVLAFLCFYGGLLFLFSFLVFLFLPLGQLVGRGFLQKSPISAYSVNILGALSGIYAYNGLTYLHTSPVLWFSLGAIPFLALLWPSKRFIVLSFAFLAVALGLQFYTFMPRMWSLYNRISVYDSYYWLTPQGESVIYPTKEGDLRDDQGREGKWVKVGKRLDVGDLFYMDISDFSPQFLTQYPQFYGKAIELYSYNLPYTLFPPKRVCIVGSGGGNDVAAALRAKVPEILAVEIDPLVIEMGRHYHPERPYQQKEVQVRIEDARHFLNQGSEPFDLILYGLLDSHSLFSTFSSVRLDNYVYTVEAFQQAQRLLSPEGLLICSFATKKPWMIERFYRTFNQVFEQETFLVDSGRGITLINGKRKDFAHVLERHGLKNQAHLYSQTTSLPLATDDWPFMYQKEKSLSWGFCLGLLLMAFGGFYWIWKLLPTPRHFQGNALFFWLGVSFLLVEVKNISQLALVWGSTWKVNAIVIGGIMALLLIANTLVQRFHWKNGVGRIYILLILALGLTYYYPLDWGLDKGWFLAQILPTFVFISPLFLAGLWFAIALQESGPSADQALGWNLMGSVLGGFLEYFSVVAGFRFLTFIALATYSLAFWSFPFRTNFESKA